MDVAVVRDHVSCGRRSGYPACCVAWFAFVSHRFADRVSKYMRYDWRARTWRVVGPRSVRIAIWLLRGRYDDGAHYVRCPFCRLIGRTVSNDAIRYCESTCCECEL